MVKLFVDNKDICSLEAIKELTVRVGAFRSIKYLSPDTLSSFFRQYAG